MHICNTKQQISWEDMKIGTLKTSNIIFLSFFLSVTLHVSCMCFMKLASSPDTKTHDIYGVQCISTVVCKNFINVDLISGPYCRGYMNLKIGRRS